MRREVLGLLGALVASAALAQVTTADPDWRESEAPPPPALNTTRLIPLDMSQSSLRYGVDPASVAIGEDGIVRYVVVATSSSGAVNAMYEGIRCNTGEFRTYARHSPGSGWVRVQSSDWRSLHDGALASKHSLQVARTGACIGHAPNRPASQIVRDLGASPDTRFRNERR